MNENTTFRNFLESSNKKHDTTQNSSVTANTKLIIKYAQVLPTFSNRNPNFSISTYYDCDTLRFNV